MEPVIVGMDRYELASQLTFYAPDHARSVKETSSRNLFGQNGLMYGRWASSLGVGNRTLLLVAWDPDDISDELTAPYVASLGAPKEGELTRAAPKSAISTTGSPAGWRLIQPRRSQGNDKSR